MPRPVPSHRHSTLHKVTQHTRYKATARRHARWSPGSAQDFASDFAELSPAGLASLFVSAFASLFVSDFASAFEGSFLSLSLLSVLSLLSLEAGASPSLGAAPRESVLYQP